MTKQVSGQNTMRGRRVFKKEHTRFLPSLDPPSPGFEIIMGSFWDHVGTLLRYLSDSFGIIWGSFWDRFGIALGSFWDRFGFILGSFWDLFGIILGSLWDRFGIVLG